MVDRSYSRLYRAPGSAAQPVRGSKLDHYRYWLYVVVFDSTTPARRHWSACRTPFDKLLAKHRASSMFTIAAAALMKVMERP